MTEKIIKNSKPHFLELIDLIGDKTVINLDNVNYFRVDFDCIKVLFKGDQNEHTLRGYSAEALKNLNNIHF